MKHFINKFAAIFLLGLSSFSSHADLSQTIGTYNLILLDNYSGGGIHVHGAAFFGGDINTNSATVFGSRLTSDNGYGSSIDAVTVVGDVNAPGITIENGHNLVYGGTLNSPVNLNGGGSTAQGNAAALQSLRDSLAQQLYADVALLSGLTANGSVEPKNPGNNPNSLVYSGTDSTAVFNVSGTDLFSNGDIFLDAGIADTIVINVSGKDISMQGNLNTSFPDSSMFSKIVWNFFEAETINFNNRPVYGSVLAPYAHIVSGGDFDGSLAARSYSGNQQFHHYLFSGSVGPTAAVPEPSLFFPALLGFGFLVARQRRTQK